jgi:hypothetical protein
MTHASDSYFYTDLKIMLDHARFHCMRVNFGCYFCFYCMHKNWIIGITQSINPYRKLYKYLHYAS